MQQQPVHAGTWGSRSSSGGNGSGRGSCRGSGSGTGCGHGSDDRLGSPSGQSVHLAGQSPRPVAQPLDPFRQIAQVRQSQQSPGQFVRSDREVDQVRLTGFGRPQVSPITRSGRSDHPFKSVHSPVRSVRSPGQVSPVVRSGPKRVSSRGQTDPA